MRDRSFGLSRHLGCLWGAIGKEAVLGDVDVGPRPEIAQIVGTAAFARSDAYKSDAKFRADEVRHWIHEGSVYD